MLVFTGQGRANVFNNTEVLKLDSKDDQVPTYQNHSKSMSGATGGFLANQFITCGGCIDGESIATRNCYKVGPTNSSLHGSMKGERRNAASIVLADRLWILGGISKCLSHHDGRDSILKSTEYILHDGRQEDGPDLPISLHDHAGIQINGTHFMIIGGRSTNGQTDKTWVYSNGNWYNGPVLTKARYYHSVGKIRDSVNHKDFIVVAGGEDVSSYFKDTEILEIDSNVWKAGKLL